MTTIDDLKPNDIVYTCKWIERGLCPQIWGLTCCVHGTLTSPTLVTTEEIKAGKVDYDLIVKRKQELFEAINGIENDNNSYVNQEITCKNCANLFKTKFKNVNFEYIGGLPLPSLFNIQHYTQCNERCSYCCYVKDNQLVPPQYDILKIFDLFKNKGKLLKNAHIDFSGGEPAVLKDFDKILTYFVDNEMGDVAVYSNASIFNSKFCKLLEQDNISLTTSLDTGLKSTYTKLRGADVFEKVIENLVKYRNSGTGKLFLKYVITEQNRTEDDMWSFILAMLAFRPNLVMICPDFPYGNMKIPQETVMFAAKLWYYIEKYLGNIVIDYTFPMGDPKFVKYHKELAEELNKLKKLNPICAETRLQTYHYPVCKCNKTDFKDKLKKIKIVILLKYLEIFS